MTTKKSHFIIVLAMSLTMCTVFGQSPQKYAQTITSGELKEMLYIYASDSFEGRYTGKEGQKKAVAFLMDFYNSHSIKPANSNGDYFQDVPLRLYKNFSGKCKVGGKTYEFGKDIVFDTTSESPLLDKKLVYVGYGVENDSYSGYKGVSVKGKVVLIKKGLPSSFSESSWTAKEKVDLAIQKGAIAVLIEDDDLFSKMKTNLKRINNSKPYLSYEKNPFYSDKPFIAAVSEDFIPAVCPKLLVKNKTKKLKSVISLDFELIFEDMDSENVVAYFEGEEKPDEYLVLSAHLDHIGTDSDGNVYNGADDDGSGTVALLEIAEAFQQAIKDGFRPKRSVVFLHVTGEELGLWGSKYYSEHPLFPLKQTITDLNVDMIGRIDPKHKEGDKNYVYLIGSDKLSTDLHNISEAVNKACCNMTLDYTYNDENDPNRFYYRSDHYNFAKYDVPIIFYFNGTHADYHKITDTPDKIDYDLLTNRARLIFHTAWELANRDRRPVVDKVK